MSAEFRIIHFVSDPFLGARFPVAALLREEGDEVRVIRAQHLPGPDCLGGAAYSAALRMVLEALDASPTFDQLPETAGPMVTMAEAMPVPDAVRDPAKWLLQVLPATRASERGRVREVNRSSVGYRFFQTWNVSHYVRKQFRFSDHWKSLAIQKSKNVLVGATSTDSVSHWVEGSKKVLLMEPLIPSRRSFSEDVHHVAHNFSAYRYHLGELQPKKAVLLVAYLLPHRGERRSKEIDHLRKVAHRIVDLTDESSQKGFVRQVESIGKSGQSMLNL